MTPSNELTAEQVATMINASGVRVTTGWVVSRIPGGRVRTGRAYPGKGHPLVWRERDVLKWMKKHGLDRPRRLVRIDDLARIKGLGYWEARRTHEPAVVLGYSNKWYDLDA